MPDTLQSLTLGGLVAEARRSLTEAGIEDAALEARLLVEHFMGTDRAATVLEPGQIVDAALVDAVYRAMERRLAGEPVHRIIGFRDFYNVRLSLSPATLEPRPDTETLVDLVLPMVRHMAAAHGACRILDLGTGTGAVALSLLKEEPGADAIATDICADALVTAQGNADINGVSERFEVLKSDWFENVTGHFHIIVSNPPYIASNAIVDLQREVRAFDPISALDGGPDGLAAYRAIAEGAGTHLLDTGYLALEVGFDQKCEVEAIFSRAGFVLERTARDLGGHERAMMFRR